MKEVTVQELKAMMDAHEDFQLIDVRESYEVEICSLGGQHIPMGEVMSRMDEVSKDRKVVVHCRSGGRSGTIVQFLESSGYDNVYNLKGGILAWADQVDTAMPKY
jgi:adenylyltransferase/sulfurtransferase